MLEALFQMVRRGSESETMKSNFKLDDASKGERRGGRFIDLMPNEYLRLCLQELYCKKLMLLHTNTYKLDTHYFVCVFCVLV